MLLCSLDHWLEFVPVSADAYWSDPPPDDED
jgi:hypothetical protein